MNKALLIGINTYQNVGPNLAGCVNDVDDMTALLMTTGGVSESEIARLMEDRATRQGIADAIKALVANAKVGDHLYIHFSGHGAQIPTSDPQEPDGADEVLCPCDFAWTRESALTDDDLRALLGPLVAGAQVTFTADACHSGDFSRALRTRQEGAPRTPIRPAAIAIQRQSTQRVRRLRSVESVGSSAYVSACRPWETAKDTSFDGRAAGAFTHFFASAIRNNPKATLDDIVEQIGPSLVAFEMHPIAEGSDDVRGKHYSGVQERGLRAFGAATVIERPRSLTTVWEDSWSADVLGQRGEVALAVTLSGNDIVGHVRTHFFGGGEWHVALNGNAVVPLDLAFGVQLCLSVRDWSLAGAALRFRLAFDVYSRFFGSIPVGSTVASVELDSLARGAASCAPQSAADFMALVNLNTSSLQTGARTEGRTPALWARRDPGDVVPMADGEEGWGPNWREDRAVYPHSLVARATKRVGVALDPVRGGGHAEFVRWLTDNDRDPSFVMHIGNGFFGGWGSVKYHVEGVYEVDNPFPKQ